MGPRVTVMGRELLNLGLLIGRFVAHTQPDKLKKRD